MQSAVDARLDVVEGNYIDFSPTDSLYRNSVEFVQSEDKFTEVRDGLKTLNKMDFDKLIASVRASPPRLPKSLTLIYL